LLRFPTLLVAVGAGVACSGDPVDAVDPTTDPGTGPSAVDTGTPGTTDTTDTDTPTTELPGCYPEGAVEPMAVGAVLFPYRWPTAIHRDGRRAPLDLAHAPCADDAEIDWSPHDALVFVSIPAW
jgi:hypothetical protein